MEKLEMQSKNIYQEKINQIGKLFPNCISNKEINGKSTPVIDFELLKDELSDEIEETQQKYIFTWPDKDLAKKIANYPTNKCLRPCIEKSLNFEMAKNIYIEGDNLDVLKILRETYIGKISAIYIDPPYNTGSDFIYKDNFTQNIDDYIKLSGQIDECGNRLVENTEANGRFHTDWLNMMYPRIKLARDLLTDDGLIFISIDDHEFANLKKICDEILGEQNYVSTIAVELSKTQGMKVKAAQNGQLVKNHEYILVYCKNILCNTNRKPLYDAAEPYDAHYNKVMVDNKLENITDFLKNSEANQLFDNHGLKINLQNIAKLMSISEEFNEFIMKHADIIYRDMPCNICIPEDIDEKVKHGCITKFEDYLLTRSTNGTITQYSSFKETLNQSDDYDSKYMRTTIRGALWKGFYSDMMNIAKEGGVQFKNGKKPVRLIKQLLKYTNRVDGLVLDFFSGSGTTGQAIAELNDEYNYNMNFILVQLPEQAKKDTKYDLITDLGEDRIKNVLNTINSNHPEKKQGLRIFKLDSSNMNDVYYTPEKTYKNTLDLLEDSIKKDRNEEDLLFQVMLELDIELSAKINVETINGKKIFSVDDDYLIACFDDNIDEQIVENIAKRAIRHAIIRESSIDSDSTYTNFEQIFKTYNPNIEPKVL